MTGGGASTATAPALRPAAEPAAEPAADPLVESIDAVIAMAMHAGREDLAARLDAVSQRIARTDTVICVVGEFKQGKSALINGLLGAPVCPVDDDLATTAVTVVRHADTPTVTVRRRGPDGPVNETIPVDDLASWAMERDRPTEGRSDVELVEVGFPHPLLQAGVTLVDTPGVGGLNAGHAAATLAFLPTADALVFVTDASAELSATELAFVSSALRAGPPVMVAVTKVDMYPAWRRIVDLDAERLRAIELTDPPFALSAVLRRAAIDRSDPALEASSGYPPFEAALNGDALRSAKDVAREQARRLLQPVLAQLAGPVRAEMAGLDRSAEAGDIASRLRDVRTHLATLAEADASWAVRLEDEFGTLRQRVTFAFAAQMRRIIREAQDDAETGDPAETWPELSQRVQEQAARAVGEAFLAASDGATEIRATIAAMLADEEVGLDAAGAPIAFDVIDLWEGRPEFAGRARRGVMAGFGVFTGAKAGIDMLGMLGTLLGAAIVGPAVLGVALAFGGKEVLSERRRLLTERRQQAREFLAGFLEEVRFEADGRLTALLADVLRQMRAQFADRIRELERTYTTSAAALARAAEADAANRRQRRAAAAADLAEIDRVAARIEALGPGVVASEA